jgi:putative ABC transport system substrate-binding protein
MKRREFITMVGAAVAWPLPARAQQPWPMVGFLHGAFRTDAYVAGLVAGLKDEFGYVADQNVAVEYRWAEGHYDRLPALANDLVARRLAVIIAGGGPATALAVKAATNTLPIVFVAGSDPVKFGLVSSLSRPEANITGVVFFNSALVAKRLELLRELVPAARVVAYLANPSNPETAPEMKDMEQAARTLGIEVYVIRAGTDREIEAAFASLQSSSAGGVVVASDPFLGSRRRLLGELTIRYAMPVISSNREFIESGGLISYGTSIPDAYRQAGIYAARILRGTKPADLPVVQSAKFDLAINLKTAKALGLSVPPKLLFTADEVIE